MIGLELAKAFITVQADSSKLPGDLNKVQGTTTGFMNKLTGMISGKLAAALAVVVGSFGTINSLMKAGQFEQTTIAFETMLGSAKETEKTLASLTEFAAKTPFEMPEILQAARGLIQFGERGDDMIETMNMLGNAASGTSTPFGMLALVFNQVRGVGKLLTQDFRQLSTRGILSLKDIAKHYGVTTEAAQKMLSTGKVSFEDLKDIFRGLSAEGGRFHDLMERQSKSMLGLWSTFKDQLGITSRVLGDQLLPVAKQIITAAIEAADGARKWVMENTALIGTFVKMIIVAAKIGVAITAVKFAIKSTTAAMILLKGVSGPVGWAQIAAGVAYASAAIIALNLTLDDSTTDVSGLTEENEKLLESMKRVAAYADREKKTIVNYFKDIPGAAADLFRQTNYLLTGAGAEDNPNITEQQRRDSVKAGTKLVGEDDSRFKENQFQFRKRQREAKAAAEEAKKNEKSPWLADKMDKFMNKEKYAAKASEEMAEMLKSEYNPQLAEMVKLYDKLNLIVSDHSELESQTVAVFTNARDKAAGYSKTIKEMQEEYNKLTYSMGSNEVKIRKMIDANGLYMTQQEKQILLARAISQDKFMEKFEKDKEKKEAMKDYTKQLDELKFKLMTLAGNMSDLEISKRRFSDLPFVTDEQKKTFDSISDRIRGEELRKQFESPVVKAKRDIMELGRLYDEGAIGQDTLVGGIKGIRSGMMPQKDMSSAGITGFRQHAQNIQNAVLSNQDPNTKELREMKGFMKNTAEILGRIEGKPSQSALG